MALNLEGKREIVAEVAAVAASAHSAVAAEYRGISVSAMTELRARARDERVYLRVVKNTLARRAVVGTEFECMQPGFIGPLVLAFSQEDPGAAARLVRNFAQQHDQLRTRLVAVGGQLMDASALDRLADLPTREQALSRLLGVMKAPIAKLVGTLAAPHSTFVRLLAAVQQQKQTTE